MKYLKYIAALALIGVLSPLMAGATPVSWDGNFSSQLLQPLQSFWGAEIKGSFFTATSTTDVNTFPELEATNATTTNATTTTSAISSLASKLLRTNGNGTILETTIGDNLAFDGTTLSADAQADKIATSSSETSTYVPFWDSTGATPALLSGGEATFAYNSTLNRLTVTNATTTAITTTHINSGNDNLLITSNLGNLTFSSGSGDFVYESPFGLYEFDNGSGSLRGVLDFSSVASSEKTFALPNESGTFILGSGATGRVPYYSSANAITSSASFLWDNTLLKLTATNISATNATTSTQHITGLATAAGAFLAVDPAGQVIATSTPGGAGTVTSIATTYPITGGTITDTGTIGIAFGTTTSNTWAGTQIFTYASSTLFSIGATGATPKIVFSEDGDGALTIQGIGNNANEDLVYNFDDTANTVELTSSTGVNVFDFNTINVQTDTVEGTGDADTDIAFSADAITITAGGVAAITITEAGSDTLTFGNYLPSFTNAPRPTVDDGATLGISGTAWSDLFLASGGVINFGAGNYTATHSAGLLTLSGGLTASAGTATFGTLAGALDAGGATSFEIPNGTGPTTNATGEIAWDTTGGQLRLFDGAADRILATGTSSPSLNVASTTMDAAGRSFSSGTTSLLVRNSPEPTTLAGWHCKATSTGSVLVRFGDGTNWTNAGSCSTSGVTTYATGNNTFTSFEDMVVQIGTQASNPSRVTITTILNLTSQ